MKDAADARMLDVVLWAYNKLNLNKTPEKTPDVVDEKADDDKVIDNSNRKVNKSLSDIKFIFVIRDCQELTNLEWLEIQKNKINR